MIAVPELRSDKSQTAVAAPTVVDCSHHGNTGTSALGWVGFCVASQTANGSIGGVFTRVVWDAIQSSQPLETPNFGVRAVNLVR